MSNQFIGSDGVLVLPNKGAMVPSLTNNLCVYSKGDQLTSMDSTGVETTLTGQSINVLEHAFTSVQFLGEKGLPAVQGWTDSEINNGTITVSSDVVFGTTKDVIRYNVPATGDMVNSTIPLVAANWVNILTFGASYSGVCRIVKDVDNQKLFSGMGFSAANDPRTTSIESRIGINISVDTTHTTIKMDDGSVLILDGFGGKPLVLKDEYFSWEVFVDSTPDAGVTFGTVTVFVNNTQVATSAITSSNSSVSDAISVLNSSAAGSTEFFLASFGVTIYQESPTKTLTNTDFAGFRETALIYPPGIRNYTTFLAADIAGRNIGDKFTKIKLNVGGMVTLTDSSDPINITFDGLNSLMTQTSASTNVSMINMVQGENVWRTAAGVGVQITAPEDTGVAFWDEATGKLKTDGGVSMNNDGAIGAEFRPADAVFVAGIAQIYTDAVNGLIIAAPSGTVNDVTVIGSTANIIMRVPNGTTDSIFQGDVSATGNISAKSFITGLTVTAMGGTFGLNEDVIGVTDTTVARTITLATAAMFNGKTLIVQDQSGLAAINNITINTEGTEQINGADSIVIDKNYGAVDLYSDGSDWFMQAFAVPTGFVSSGVALQLEELTQTATHTADFSSADPQNTIIKILNIPTFIAILTGVYEFNIIARILDIAANTNQSSYFMALFVDGIRDTGVIQRYIGRGQTDDAFNLNETIVRALTAGQTVDFGFSHNSGTDDSSSISDMQVTCKQLAEKDGGVNMLAPDDTAIAFWDTATGKLKTDPKVTIDASGNVTHDSFTTLGAGNVKIKIKKLTGISASAQGNNALLTHGLNFNKIICVQALVTQAAGNRVAPGYTRIAGHEYDLLVDSASVFIQNSATNSASILTKLITVLVTYEP